MALCNLCGFIAFEHKSSTWDDSFTRQTKYSRLSILMGGQYLFIRVNGS